MAHRQHDDARRLHGVFCGKNDSAVVVPSLKFCTLRTHDRKVPLKQVVLGWDKATNEGMYQMVH